MKKEEILSNLCYYDKRNPIKDGTFNSENEHIFKKKEKCFCDNCFYGRTKLAEEILRLQEKLDLYNNLS